MQTIVLIEDDFMLRSMYESKLRKGGYEVLAAGDGATGLTHIQSRKPELVVMDVMFPKFDGFKILQIIKEQEDTKHIHVVFLTNLAQDEDIEKGKSLGASGYLIKSEVTPKELLEWVNKVLEN